MSPRKPGTKTGAKLPVRNQVSAGGVVFRERASAVDVVLIAVGSQNRWQLPKGLVEKNEEPATAAVREAREEAGVASEVVEHIETIEYWYAGLDKGERVRFHKLVHFFLMRYVSGDPGDHDWEVNEARWVPIDAAMIQLTFENERHVMARAREMIAGAGAGDARQ
ncbi:MAG TPA: NUDIX hydrolase [Gemmatimonadaceae bacterium]|nr:NUDIX hydrolase [Gemmatimonadaceae bacterium]